MKKAAQAHDGYMIKLPLVGVVEHEAFSQRMTAQGVANEINRSQAFVQLLVQFLRKASSTTKRVAINIVEVGKMLYGFRPLSEYIDDRTVCSETPLTS